jgi:hypothetical protein
MPQKVVLKNHIKIMIDSHLHSDWVDGYLYAILGNNPNYQYVEKCCYSTVALTPGSTPNFIVWETKENWGHLEDDGTFTVFVENIGHVAYTIPEHLLVD